MRKKKEESKKEKQSSCFATKSEIKSAMSENRPLLVLMCKEALFSTNDLNSSLPRSIVSLLQEYKDLFLEETPSKLPPIRGIEHQIDFLLGASIPNRPTYRSSLEETK